MTKTIGSSEFPRVFTELRSILKPYAQKLSLKADTQDLFSIDGPYSTKYKKELFFAAVKIQKNYVSFYLMPVYMHPDLLKGISLELRKHMPGKSCFNFKKVEPALFSELATLTEAGFKKFSGEFSS